MNRYFTRTFFVFLSGFLILLAVAFLVVVLAGAKAPAPVDNTALPK